MGGVRRASRSLRTGSAGASAGARTASSVPAAMTSAPTSATPWRPTRITRQSRDPGSRIDEAVDDVHGQVDDDEDDGEDDDRGLDDREVARRHRLDHQSAEAGPGEDGLDD